MVVVDNARKMIGKTVDISVTSVLQTTAGKMIFGKFDDRMAAAQARQMETRPPDLRPPTNDVRKSGPTAAAAVSEAKPE